MNQAEISALLKGIAPAIGDLVSRSIQPLVERLVELERQIAGMPVPKDGRDGNDGRDGVDGTPGANGKDAEPITDKHLGDAVAAYLLGHPPLDGKDGRDGADGKDADPSVVAQLVVDEVAKAVTALPKPQDGRSIAVEDVAPLIATEVQKAVAALPAIEPIQPNDEHLRSLIAPMVEALPKPQDGKSLSADEMSPLIAELVSAALADAVKAIPPAKDGRDGVDGKNGLDAVTPILKDGVLLFTMSDGTIKDVGRVVGADGKDGDPGRDGLDGLGFDDMSAEYDGERGIVLRFVRNDVTKEFAFTMPVLLDRGVWDEGRDGGYAKGDAVTWAGSVWISQKDANGGKPDGGDGWRLSVKRGRDGKDGMVRDMTPKPVKVT